MADIAVGVHVVVPVRLCALAADDVFEEQRDIVHPDLPVAGLGAATNPAERRRGPEIHGGIWGSVQA